MTRTTEALKRLGVAGIVMATAGSALVALPAVASAAPATTVVFIDPADKTDETFGGTCENFAVQLNTNDATNAVTVTLTEGTSTTAPSTSARFCDASTGAITNGTTQTFTDTDANGVINFGVVDTFNTAVTGGENNITTVTARLNNTQAFDVATLLVTQAPNQNDQNLVVDADPNTDVNVVGEAHEITVTVDSANGKPVAGIVPTFTVAPTGSGTGNTVAPTDCAATNSVGVSKCTYTGTTAGTDTITVYVNQQRAGQANARTRDGSPLEPGDVISKTYQAAPTARTISLDPDSVTQTIAGTNTQTFTVTVDSTTASGTSTNGTLVRFTVDDANATLNQSECTTAAPTGTAGSGTPGSAAQGSSTGASTCTVTVTVTNATGGQTVVVTAVVAGTSVRDSSVLNLVSGSQFARFISLSPTGVTTSPGGARTFTATVTDAQGNPVPGVSVFFEEDGAGFIRSSSTITDAQGRATVEVSSGSAETGTQTIKATISSPSQCAQTGTTATTPSGGTTATQAGRCTATATNEFKTAPPADNPPPNPSDTAVARITLNVTSGRITAGNAPFLFGIVSDRNGNPLANRDVTILEKRYNTASYQELQTATDVTTDSQGRFRVRVQPERQTAYVARATGTTVQSDAGSRPVIVQVHNRINIAQPVGGTVAAGRALTVRGDLDPNYASVRIGVAALRNGRFTYITQGITDNNGAFVINVRNLPTGTYALVVYTSARQGNLFGSASRSITSR